MPLYEHSFRAMGCPCRLRLECDDGALAQAAIAAAEAEVRRLEEKYSRYLPDSLTTRINRNAGGEPVAIDPETAGLLGFAHTLWEQSDGRFDLTAGILRRAWDFRSGKLPSQVAIDRLLPLIGWQQVQWSADTIRLPQRGMEIDFGGCVKEYASDSAAGLLADHGIRRALVDLGGDIAVSGAACRASPWPVGIRHPRARGEALAGILLAAGGLASSGDYERCLIVEGRRYGHILNPATGWPVQGLVAVSVLAEQCLVAGGSATLAMLREEGAALAWLEELGLPWLAVDTRLGVHGRLGRSVT